MKKRYILILLLCFAKLSFAQFGYIQIDASPQDSTPIFVHLTQHDSIIFFNKYKYFSGIMIDSLKPGYYDLSIKKLGYVTVEYKQIKVDSNYYHLINCNLINEEGYYDFNNHKDTFNKTISNEIAISYARYDNRWFNNDGIVKISNSFTFISNYYVPILKRMSGGFFTILNYTQASLITDKLSLLPSPAKREIYHYLKYSLGLGTRLFYKQQKKYSKYVLDLAILYHLPIYFTYVGIYDDKRTYYRNLHQYTDFSVYSSLGISPGIAISADYRLTDYLKHTYPELPRLQFGIVFFLM